METNNKSGMCAAGTCGSVCSCRWYDMKMIVSIALGILLAAAIMAIVGSAVRMMMGDTYGRGMHQKMMQKEMMMNNDMPDDMMNTMPEGSELPVGQDGAAY